MQLKNRKIFFIGFAASLSLLILYFFILSLAESFSHATSQFLEMWYWISVLAAGFGLQVGLYFYIRTSFRLKQTNSPTTAVAASGGISTGSMIACCLHHLVDVLPIMGLAAVALFLTKYQTLFLLVGVLSNLIGIIIMLEFVQKNNLASGFLKKILIYPMGKIKKATIVFSLVLVLILFFWQGKETPSMSPATINLSSKTNSQAGISFDAIPLNFSFDQLVKFEIKIDTHSGFLDFDLAKISILEDDHGNKYQPLEWSGAGTGGHHLSGILTFPELKDKTKKIKLVIQDNFLRIFEWELE